MKKLSLLTGVFVAVTVSVAGALAITPPVKCAPHTPGTVTPPICSIQL